MEGNIVKAATSFGVCIIISAVILFVGMGRLGKSVERAGSNARSHVSVPSSLTLKQSSQFKVAPIRLDVNSTGGLSFGTVNVDVKSGGNRILQ